MRLLKLTGTINTHYEGEEILRKAIDAGAFNAALMSREIVLEVAEARLKRVRDTLHSMHVSDIRLREASAIESTVTHSGNGCDPKKCVKVSLAPGTRITGMNFLSISFLDQFRQQAVTEPEILSNNAKRIISDVLKKSGITDVLVSVDFQRVSEDIDLAIELATVKALVEADGLVQVTTM